MLHPSKHRSADRKCAEADQNCLQSRLASAASGSGQSLNQAAVLVAASETLQATIPEDPNEGGTCVAQKTRCPVCFSSSVS